MSNHHPQTSQYPQSQPLQPPLPQPINRIKHQYPSTPSSFRSNPPSPGSAQGQAQGQGSSQVRYNSPIPNPISTPQHGHGRQIQSSTYTPDNRGQSQSQPSNPNANYTPVISTKPIHNQNYNTPSNANAVASSSRVKLDSGRSSQRQPQHRQAGAGLQNETNGKMLGKRKRTEEEEGLMKRATEELAHHISLDQSLTTSTYIPAHPFEDYKDVVERLVPWHVWQIYDEDLDLGGSRSGRGRGRGREGEDTQRVVSLIERQIKLENRMRALRLQGKETPDSILPEMQIHNLLLPQFRDETYQVQNQVRDARAAHESLIREKEYEKRRRDEAERRRIAAEEAKRVAAGASVGGMRGGMGGMGVGGPGGMNRQMGQAQGQANGNGNGNIIGNGNGMPRPNQGQNLTQMQQGMNGSSRPGQQYPAQLQSQSISTNGAHQSPARLPIPNPNATSSKPITVAVPQAHYDDLLRLRIVPGKGRGQVKQGERFPGEEVKWAKDGSSVGLAVNVQLLNPDQLAFLAKIVQDQRQNKPPGSNGKNSPVGSPAPVSPSPQISTEAKR